MLRSTCLMAWWALCGACTAASEPQPEPHDAGVVLPDAGTWDTGSLEDAGEVFECAAHADCGAQARCVEGACLPRPEAEQGFLFERVRIARLHDHWSGMPVLGGTGMEFSSVIGNLGFGGALFDMDGDHDLDLFLGTQGYGDFEVTPACVFENRSRPTHYEFVPVDGLCEPRDEMPHSGFGLDLEGDGYHELLVTGVRLMELHRFHPERRVIDLRALVPEEDGRANCNAGAGLSADINRDGLVDLVLGCQHGPINEPPNAVYHLVFLQRPDGSFDLLERSEWDRARPLLLHAHAVTLGLGGADVNDDGLLDLLVCEDQLQGNLPPDDPGGVYIACAPDESCRYRPYRLGRYEKAAGNYMGAGIAVLEGLGPHLYVTDIGANRLVELGSSPPNDRAQEANADLAGLSDQLPWIAWGVVVDDFNRDGRDDLVVSQGSLLSDDPSIYEAHFDAVLIQRDGARFSLHSEDVGIETFSREDSSHWANPYAGRGLLKADLDSDGMLELIQFGVDGRLRIHREVPVLGGAAPRCTLVPKDRYVSAFGMGHDLIGEDGIPRSWDVQGQLRAGASPFVVSPWRSGQLRFPSGAIVPFDCGESTGAVVVEEPEWLRLARQGSMLRIRLTEQAPAQEVRVWVEPLNELLEPERRDDGWYLRVPEGAQRMMLKLGARWLSRTYRL